MKKYLNILVQLYEPNEFTLLFTKLFNARVYKALVFCYISHVKQKEKLGLDMKVLKWISYTEASLFLVKYGPVENKEDVIITDIIANQ